METTAKVLAVLGFLAAVLLLLAGCANVSGKPLPMIHDDDPVYTLTPDHIEALPQ